MEWNNWIGKKVFIKLKDGSIFSKSLVKEIDENFITIVDRDLTPATIALSEILKIVEDEESEIQMR